MTRMKKKYVEEVAPALMEKFQYKSVMQIPKIEKMGMKVGVKVTLRQDRMWEFLDRLFNVALPRVRDFRGISADAFDGRGNYSLGLREQIIFPEIEYDKIEKLRGMNIAITTTAKTDEEARELLRLMGAQRRRQQWLRKQ